MQFKEIKKIQITVYRFVDFNFFEKKILNRNFYFYC